ncbi:MAG: sensor histidine kinase, partial [Sphingomonadaceae bacterium]|nr:sensor histidine kinase [Sphingomonadaceae bacterium]
PARAILESKPEAHLKGDGLDISVPSRSGGSVAVAHYPARVLGALARPSGFSGPLTLELQTPDGLLPLVSRENQMLLADQTYGAPVGLLDLSLDMTVDEVPFSAADALLTFLPLLMWASAAALGFLVVDRLLIGPLEALRAAVAAYRPGQPFVFPKMRTPAREIRELGQAVEKFGSELATHEAGLERALADQVKLTREVHHRVKNNLQVVASLISLHARGAPSRDAADAYASIQRRVDALAIVHRNHFAEIESGHGIAVKALIGELAANLRASVPVDAIAPAITVTAAHLRITQDSAMPIAFLLTELAELSMAIDIAAPIAVSIDRIDDGHARLNIESRALRGGAAFQKRLEARYSRVITGLARQMRATLDHDDAEGRYTIVFPVLDAA